MRRGEIASPCFGVKHAQRLHRVVVVVKRLAHSHQHDVERLVQQPGRGSKHHNLPDDLSGGEMPDQPHLAGQAEAARHRAAHLRRDAEGHGRRIRDEHGFDPAPVAQLEDELPRPVGRQLVADDHGPPDRESRPSTHPEASFDRFVI